MQPRLIFKSGAVVLIVAIAIEFISEALRVLALNGGDPKTAAGDPLFVPTFVLALVGTTLLVVSIPVTYARQAAKAGKTGAIGLACYVASGLVFGYGIAAISAIIVPFIYADPRSRVVLESSQGPPGFVPFYIAGILLFTIGNLCYGIGTLRARIYPRAVGFSLCIAAILEVAGFVTGAASINLPGWTDLITDIASFGAVAAMAIWLLREPRTGSVDQVEGGVPLAVMVSAQRPNPRS
jgi:hypothetical protein